MTMTSVEYAARGGVGCPVCKSEAIETGRMGIDMGIAWQHCTCEDCGAAWEDQYKLIGYYDLEKGDE